MARTIQVEPVTMVWRRVRRGENPALLHVGEEEVQVTRPCPGKRPHRTRRPFLTSTKQAMMASSLSSSSARKHRTNSRPQHDQEEELKKIDEEDMVDISLPADAVQEAESSSSSSSSSSRKSYVPSGLGRFRRRTLKRSSSVVSKGSSFDSQTSAESHNTQQPAGGGGSYASRGSSRGSAKSRKPVRKAPRNHSEQQKRSPSSSSSVQSAGGSSRSARSTITTASLKQACSSSSNNSVSSTTTTTRQKNNSKAPSPSSPVRLSQASTESDEIVYNDILKVVLVGAQTPRASWLLSKLTQKPCRGPVRGAEGQVWHPAPGLTAHIWNAQGSAHVSPERVHQTSPWAHPGTQSLYATDHALHILLWDLEGSYYYPSDHPSHHNHHHHNNPQKKKKRNSVDMCPISSVYMDTTCPSVEAQALLADIAKNVLPWIDIVGQSGLHSAILPVAIVPEGMPRDEALRRCHLMGRQLNERIEQDGASALVQGLYGGAEEQSRVILIEAEHPARGLGELRNMIVAMSNPSVPLFQHVGARVPVGTVLLRNLIQELAPTQPIVPITHLFERLQGHGLHPQQVRQAILFLSAIGDVLYYGDRPRASSDFVLSLFVILDRRWLASALSCLLREDLKSKVVEMRRHNNVFVVDDDSCKLVPDLDKEGCPLIFGLDAPLLWYSNPAVRKAFEDCSKLVPESFGPNVIHFLEKLFLQAGVTVPLSMEPSPIFPKETLFIPSILTNVSPEIWTYKSKEPFTTTLCYSWVFRYGAPSTLMEYLSVGLLRHLNDFAQGHFEAPAGQGDKIHKVKIHKVLCWKSCFLTQIGAWFQEGDKLVESMIEVYVAVVDRNSPNCVASDARTKIGMDRVIVSCKGPKAGPGKIWNGGFRGILNCVKQALRGYDIAEMQVVCPTCLEQSYTRTAKTWNWGEVQSSAQRHEDTICNASHRVCSHLLCGTTRPENVERLVARPKTTAAAIRPSTVFVGIMKEGSTHFSKVGSGFVLDDSFGLVVTAAHVLYEMIDSGRFGDPLGNLDRILIGVVSPHNPLDAVLRYYAKVVTKPNPRVVDACILKIVSRLEDDVTFVGQDLSRVHAIPLDDKTMAHQGLVSLKLARHVSREEAVRLFGYDQDQEHHTGSVNLRPGFSEGHVEHEWAATSTVHSDFSPLYCPEETLVVRSKSGGGQSGGPCVNKNGSVLGILSSCDIHNRSLCYLVPPRVLRRLALEARKNLAAASTGPSSSLAPTPKMPTTSPEPADSHTVHSQSCEDESDCAGEDHSGKAWVAFKSKGDGSRTVAIDSSPRAKKFMDEGYQWVGFLVSADEAQRWKNGEEVFLISPLEPDSTADSSGQSATPSNPPSSASLVAPPPLPAPLDTGTKTLAKTSNISVPLIEFSSIESLRPSVVLIGIWKPSICTVVTVGCGFMADAKLGLVFTSQFVVETMEKIVIGFVPRGGRHASFEYFGSLLSVGNTAMGVSVLRIEPGRFSQRPSTQGTSEAKFECLKIAKSVTARAQERMRVLGFGSGEEDQCVSFANATVFDPSCVSSSDQEEIIITCPAMPNHMGCPCVNPDGRLVGMLSRVDRQLGFLVPTSQLRKLLKAARKLCKSSAR